MEILKQSRAHLKGSITRVYNFSQNIAGSTTLEVLEIKLERLTDTWKDFCANQNSLFEFHDEEGYGDPEEDFEIVEAKYIATKSALVKEIRNRLPAQSEKSFEESMSSLTRQQTAFLEQFEKSVTSRRHEVLSSEIELPRFHIEPFSGDYRAWPGFRDVFLGSIDCRKNLSGAQKLRYLISFLRGKPAELLNKITISDSSYEQAWEKLDSKYSKPLYIISEYIESFLRLPSVASPSGVHLRKLVDTADEVLRGLTSISAEGRDPWLVHILLNKTDIETRKAWALEKNTSELSSIHELIDFLEKRCSAFEASEPKVRCNPGASRSTHTSHNIKSLTVSNSLCPKCKENHSLSQCNQFLSLSIQSRRDFTRDQKLCYNCLGTKHSSSRCRVRTRCTYCGTRHHTLVHLDKPHPSTKEIEVVSHQNDAHSLAPSGSKASVVTNHIKNDIRPSGILPTVVVKVIDSTGKFHLCRVLVDTGSQVSFITEGLVKRLGLNRRHARLPITGIASLEAGITHGLVTLTLHSCHTSHEIEIEAYVLPNITSPTPLHSFEYDNIFNLNDLHLADPEFNSSGPIDVLLGSDKAWNILLDGRRFDSKGQVIAQNTVFGWVITGNIPHKELVSLHVGADVDVLLKSFWEIEEVHSIRKEDDVADEHFSKSFSRAPDSKYIVELPFREADVSFANTHSGALSRLFGLERRFSNNESLRTDYCQFMETYEELGHMQRIPENEIEPTYGKVYYLPHHAVLTNKLRVVFDGSHKDSKGCSLNETLHIGPPLQRNLLNVFMQFRLYRYVFCADIVKMFRQIWVDEKHRDFQRILWRVSPTDPVGHYRLCTVTYGTASAPYLSLRVLRQLAEDYKNQFPLAAHAILRNSYVDDFAPGSDSLSGILELKEQRIGLLSCGGLQLSKWSSNCWSIIRDTDCDQAISFDGSSEGHLKKVLGLTWNPHLDIFTFKIVLKDSPVPTKRQLLSEVAKIFDPLGFLAPSTILFKILFQELWLDKTKIGWDDTLPYEIAQKWVSYRKELPCLENLRISRRYTLNSKRFDLIGFSDASEKAYSAVVYARSRSESDGAIAINLVAAKTRVAPVKQQSIPRLELCGALLLSRLIKIICSSLDTYPVQMFAFTDSKIVLDWLSSSPRRWNTFVANRTSEILDILPRSVWNHVCSEDNPADCASRGIEPTKLLQCEIWWKGPVWISMECEMWPKTTNYIETREVPEERKKAALVHISSPVENFLCDLNMKISSWLKLVKVVAFVLRFVHKCRPHVTDKAGLRSFLSFSERKGAKHTILLWVQKEAFGEEILALKSGNQLSPRSKLISLSPFVDDEGLLRVGGRISNAPNVPFSIKHPIILPKHHGITRKILLDAHLKYLHAGVSELFALVRQEFWILGSRNLIRQLVFECKNCFRLRRATSSQLMGDLPSCRLSPSFPFAQTGCDYAGPITLRLAKGRKPKLTKGYFAIFVCMATKAMHLEAVSDLTTDAFLAAFRRFVARRGKCSVVFSDNGTNFKGAARKLSELYQLLRSKKHNEEVVQTLAAEDIRWEFIPPHSPHFGGLWESGVKCVKQHLRRVVGNAILTFEEISTLLSQIEALLNSRPLCAISDTDLNPLTPSHLLIGRPYTAIPEPYDLNIATNRLRSWELVQNMVQGFWHRWRTEYITSLQQRPKWTRTQRDFQVGDLVVLKEPYLPPSKWALGRIESTHPGNDGHVRVVSVRTTSGVFKRPITKLAALPWS